MNNSDRELQFLRKYREKLRRETDAMGYGKAGSYVPTLDNKMARENQIILPLSMARKRLALAKGL